jgi:predicted nuclease of predicted toxin-antitoxin system
MPTFRPRSQTACKERGMKVRYTMQLPAGNRITDTEIRKFCFEEGWVVVTKDKDFFYSHVLHGNPKKLLLVRCGNFRLKALIQLFERYLPEITTAFEIYNLVELFPGEVVAS